MVLYEDRNQDTGQKVHGGHEQEENVNAKKIEMFSNGLPERLPWNCRHTLRLQQKEEASDEGQG
jgi:hypothetical protein